MKSLWVFLLLAVLLPLFVLAEEKPQKLKSASVSMTTTATTATKTTNSAGKVADSVASPSMIEYKKTLLPRKPKRSNGEIPLLIIRPVEKRRKIYFKEPTVKIASGGVATYGTYPELHTSDGEMFTLEHMLPILSLEGMLKGFPKHGATISHNHFVPSPQFKPSDIHHLLAPQKTKEEYHHLQQQQQQLQHHQFSSSADKSPLKPSQLLSVSQAIPAQALPSPPPPNYVPAVNSEVQLLKLGQPQPSLSPQDNKPAFVRPEQLPASFNFKVQQQEEPAHYKVNAIPLSKPQDAPQYQAQHHQYQSQSHHHHHHHHNHPSAGGATSYVGSQTAKPTPFHAQGEHSNSQWHEVAKKPAAPTPVSVSTNYYHPKTIHAEPEQAKVVAQPAAPASPTVQTTHLSYYFPKEESQTAQTAHQVQHSPAHGSQGATSYSSVQAGGEQQHANEYVAPSKAPEPEKPLHKTYSSHIKQKYQKQQQHHHHHQQQPHVFIQKYFEFPNKSHQKTVVTEFHGTVPHNDSTGQAHPLPEPQAYAAPQYLPLPQPQALHAGPAPQTLHQAPQYHAPAPHHQHVHTHPHPHHHLQPAGPAQSYWKFGRRTQDLVKPVVEHVQEPEQPDSQHAASGMAVVRQVKHTTVLISTTESSPSSTKEPTAAAASASAQDRIDEPAVPTNATIGAPTRTPKQIQSGCERRCIRNTVVAALDPVCGTDGVTYSNRGKLRCARTCGNDDLEIRSYGACAPVKA